MVGVLSCMILLRFTMSSSQLFCLSNVLPFFCFYFFKKVKVLSFVVRISMY